MNQPMPFILTPGAALVSGGSGSLGKAIAVRLAAMRAPVLIGYASDRTTAEECVATIRAKGGLAEPVALDLSDSQTVLDALAAAERLGGGLGAVVHAAGARPHFDYLSRTPLDEWRRIMEVDVFGLVSLIQAALPLLRKSHGSIATISTYQINRLELRGGLSTIPKSAAERVLVATAREEARYGVRANVIRAGWIAGGWGDTQLKREGTKARILEKIPLGRLGTPEEIANAVAFLCSQQAGFTTGAILTVDGGQSL
jgi:NAD(P)-dependent dehydrogenase (short-subunit alcohol dehydrogenase family)